MPKDASRHNADAYICPRKGPRDEAENKST